MSTDTAPAIAPVPSPDNESEPYWAALREHRVQLQVCEGCGRRRFPPTPGCSRCGDPGAHWEAEQATGTIYSFITVHRAFDPAFADQVPYVIVTVDLDSGARMLGRLDGTPEIGARVRPAFVDHEAWTELRFLVADS